MSAIRVHMSVKCKTSLEEMCLYVDLRVEIMLCVNVCQNMIRLF